MSLIEVIIGLVLVSGMVMVFGASLSAASYAQQARLRNMASSLADEELSALQSVGASQIPVQTNGALLGVLFTQGSWAVAADDTAPSSSNAFETASSSTSSGITSLMLLPDNAYGDFTYAAKMKVLSGTPAGWKMGIVFRASDLNNLYQAYLTAGNLKLDKVVSGTNTNLYSDARSIGTNSWQTLQVVTTGTSIDLYLNGSLVTTVTDSSFSVGKTALAAWNGASAHYDDVGIGGVTTDFDGTAASDLPTGWDRFGLASLPGGTAMLTATTLYGDSSFKRADVTVRWIDRGGVRSITRSSYIRN